MKPGRFLVFIALLLASHLAGTQIAAAQTAPFEPGSVVVSRVESGVSGLAGTGNVLFLDEYTTDGFLIQSIPMPTSASGTNHRLVVAGSSVTEGGLSRSSDGRFLLLSGYDAPVPYPANLSGTSATTIPRTIGRMDSFGYLDTSTVRTDFASSGSPGSVVSPDGDFLWMTGSKGGIRYSAFGNAGGSTSTLLNNEVQVPSHLAIVNGQLYLSRDGQSPKIVTVGPGLPTSGGQILGGLPGLPDAGSPDGFFLADLSDAVPGADTLYVADDTVGLQKFSVVNSFWVSNGILGQDSDDYRGLSAKIGNNGVTLFAVRKALGAAGGGELVKITDTGGHNGAFLGEPVVLSTAPAGSAYRGVSLAPYSLPELSVSVSAPTHAAVNTSFDYTITVRNTGNEVAADIVVLFTVPEGLVVEAGPDAEGFSGPGAAGSVASVDFTGGLLAPGASATLVLSCSSPVAGTFQTSLSTPVVDPADLVWEGNEENNGAFVAARTVVSANGPAPTVFTWNDGSYGAWSEGAKWTNEVADGSPPGPSGSSNYILNFNVSESYFANNDFSPGFVLNRMNFSGSHVVNVGGSGLEFTSDGTIHPAITQNGTVLARIRPAVSAAGDLPIAVNGSAPVIISGQISSGGSVIKTGPGKLVLANENSYPGTTVIEGGTVALTDDGGPNRPLVGDGSFERPAFGAEGWSYRPDFTGWTMTGNSGVASRYSAFVDETADGSQVAFLKGEPSAISRTIEVATPGQYKLSFLGANRPGYTANGVIFKVDGLLVGSWDDTRFATSGNFIYTALDLSLEEGIHTIEFVGWNTAAGDAATCIDDVCLSRPFGLLPSESTVALNAAGTVLDLGGTDQAIVGLEGATGSSIINNGSLMVDTSLSSAFDGVMSGTGSLVKRGEGTLDLGGVNTYTGSTSVYRGSLVLNSPTLADSGGLRIETNASLELNFEGIDVVSSLSVDEDNLPAGVYNESNLPGRIIGPGSIEVVSRPVAPEIALSTPEGTEFISGGTRDFGIIPVGTPAEDTQVFEVTNTGEDSLVIDQIALGFTGANPSDFEFSFHGFSDNFYDFSLDPGMRGYLVIRFVPTGAGIRSAQLALSTNDPDETSFVINLTGGVPLAPSFTTQPANVTIPRITRTTLTALASGVPEPAYQWYRGNSGDTSNPVPDAYSATYHTPLLDSGTSYWVSATNESGTAQSETAVVTVSPPSASQIVVREAIGEDFEVLESGGTLAFGSGHLGALAQPITINVGNPGSDSLDDLQVSISGPGADDFGLSLEAFPASIGSGLSEFFVVYFIPVTEGPRAATLTITSNDADESPFILELTGEGTVPVPHVVTGGSTGVEGDFAMLHGTVNPNGTAATAFFEFGTSTAYGETSPATLDPEDGTDAQEVISALSGLAAGNTYHYRLVADNAWGTGVGEDASFTVPVNPSLFTYRVSENQVTITGYNGPGGAVFIPATIEGLPVTRVGYRAFYYNENITSVVIPEGVLFISQDAFNGCSSLASVVFPDTLTTIESFSFQDCGAMASIFIPASVTSINVSAFDSMASLTEIEVDAANPAYSSLGGVLFNKDRTTLIVFPGGVAGPYTIPSSVTTIGEYAFFHCGALVGVTIPDSVVTIEGGAFEQCAGLTSITIPTSVETIMPGAFSVCRNITSFTVVEPNVNFTSVGGVLFNDDVTTLLIYPLGLAGSYTVPSTVTHIEGNAFNEAGGLTSVIIPSSVTTIGSWAFSGCVNLASVTFLGNAPLIGSETFFGTASGFTIYWQEGATGFTSPTWEGYPAQQMGSGGNFTYIISDSQVIITGYTGPGGAVVIPGSIEGFPVVSIGSNAFGNNNTITSVVMPEGIVSINDAAFGYCQALASVDIPNTVTYIGSRAFRGTALTGVFIPASVSNIALFAFDLMPNLQAFTVDPANADYSSLGGVLFNKNQTTLVAYPGGLAGAYLVPTSVNRIEHFAFYFCSSLTGITIPETVTSIGTSAFEQCDGLVTVGIPASVISMGAAFTDCNSLVSIAVDIANPSFTGLNGVLFNKDLTTLIQYPAGKSSNYTVPSTVTTVGEGGFLNADGLTGVTLPAGLTSLGWSSFYSCDNLASISIPGGVPDIGPTTFTYCTSLASVTLSEGLQTIGNSAFEGCSQIRSIIVPSTVTSIDNLAFQICTKLTSAVFLGEAPVMGSNVFSFVGPGFTVGYFNGHGQGFSGLAWSGYSLANLGESGPRIEVSELDGPVLPSGATRDFGTVFTASAASTTKTFTIRNIGYRPLMEFGFSIVGNHQDDFRRNVSGLPMSIPAGGSGQFTVTFDPSSPGDRNALLVIMSSDTVQGPFQIALFGRGGVPPSIITQPVNQSLPFGSSSLTLGVTGYGVPSPSYRWYQGQSGDTSSPVSDVNEVPGLTITAPTSAALYWVRLTNIYGSIDSGPASILILPPPPTDANLVNLRISAGTLAPSFGKAITAYSVSVANAVPAIVLTPTTEDPSATVKVNGIPVTSGKASDIIPLNPGNNTIITEVTSRNGANKKVYTLTVIRAATTALATNPAQVVDAHSVSLKGTIMPNGVATVFFEYGTTAAYGNSTPGQNFQGTQSQAFSASLSGLANATEFHYRAVATGPFGTLYGADLTFTTAAEPPVVATGDPSAVSGSAATLVGAVDPKGLSTQVYFQYGLTALYGKNTPSKTVTSAGGILDILSPSGGLIPGATYHYRIVATSAAGTSFGNDVAFVVAVGSGVTDPIPTTSPAVATGNVAGLGTDSAILSGTVNPNRGTTLVQFQFGTTTAYGRSTTVQGVGNGSDPIEVSVPVSSLLPATTYHYRLVGSNSAGPAFGSDATFTTDPEPPSAVTGISEVLGSNSARINGSVRAGNVPATVFVDFGTNPFGFSNSVQTSPETASGPDFNPVSAELHDLGQGQTYYYRIRAVGDDGSTGLGETRSFNVALLSGLIQQFPETVLPEDRDGSLSVVILPSLPSAGWRFLGEKPWRPSVLPATGLTIGDRVIEFRPVAGFIQPPNETVAITSNGVPLVLTRNYTPSGETGSGSLHVILRPEGLTEDTRPFDLLAKWAIEGEVDGLGLPIWRDNGSTGSGLLPGNHVIICKSVTGRSTPLPVTVRIRNAETTSATVTYYVAEDPVGTPPELLNFPSISTSPDLPYSWVGQFRSDAGAGSGFVVRPGVVATAGHVMFDDGTLSSATGMQWLHRHDNQVHDPVPLNPRGYFLLTGYAAQRAIDDSPGTSTPQSQNLDAAAAYFLNDPGNGGFSGYLATDADDNEFLLSPALKTLAGYPIDGIPALDINRMHASPLANLAFTRAFGRTYTTADIRSSGGGSGGPVFVQYEDGSYYPAAIYLGGTQQTVVRAIDGDVAGLIGFAEASASANAGNTGGELTDEESIGNGNPLAGDIEVIIEPASARQAGAGWRIQAGSPYLSSGASLTDLSPNTYTVGFASVPGFVPPSSQQVDIEAGFLKRITFTYEEIVLPPVISSPPVASGTRWDWFEYQIEASHSPASYSLLGGLPSGLYFNAGSGTIYGVPEEAGAFNVLMGASNSGGADSKPLVVSSLPDVYDQEVTAPFNQPVSYSIDSSEGGDGVFFAADNLPSGLSLNPATGLIQGTPSLAGTFQVPIRVTRRGATGAGTLVMNFTGTEPVITSESKLHVVVDYGGVSTMGVSATGLPDPGYQWFIGNSGDTSLPVSGAKAPTFTTPPMVTQSSFWVLVSSISGSVNSSTFTVGVSPSANANLSDIIPSAGALFPAFNAGITVYSVAVPNEVSEFSLTPFAEVPLSTVTVNGSPVVLEEASEPVELVVGSNTILVRVIAGNGSGQKTYTLTIVRGQPPVVATEASTDLTYNSAILRGTAKPNGTGLVFFEYGTTTDYGSTTAGGEISGFSELDVQATLSGLQAETLYHFRVGLTTGGGTIYGEDMTFTTPVAPPLVATGDATDETTGKVTLIGAVDTSGNSTTAYFEFGQTTAYGFTTPVQAVPAGVVVTDIQFTAEGLVPGATYHYRLVATTPAGIWFGEDVVFVAGQANGGTGVPSGAPVATTGGVADLSTGSVNLLGTVNPRGGTSFARFDYGLTNTYGSSTVAKGIGNGSDAVTVLGSVTGLLPGRTYHYRIVASNSLGTTNGGDQTFTTGFLPPLATTGAASPLTPASARIAGTVRPRGAGAEVYFEYGIDGITFPNRVLATPGTVSGDLEVPVTVDLTNLEARVTYHYRLTAERSGNPAAAGTGEVKILEADALYGLVQKFSNEVEATKHQSVLTVNLSPPGTGAWRFVGETAWRVSGVQVGGLTTGDRLIEYLPIPGYIQPPREQVGIVTGEGPQVLERTYYFTPDAGNAAIRVILGPENVSASSVPLAGRAQWRLKGETVWRDSNVEITGLPPGNYLVECKPIPGRNTPPGAGIELVNGQSKTLTVIYPTANAPILNPPAVIPFALSSGARNFPYSYVGQFRTDAGSQSGFVVKPRVVATSSLAIFNDNTLARNTGMQWLLQRDHGSYEPTPQVPRGSYVFTGYEAQRLSEGTPGTLSMASQNLNVAALYFAEDAGRGGFSGYLASDKQANEFLVSSESKTMVGYPVNGVSEAFQGRMHATPLSAAPFGWEFGRTYSAGGIPGLGGMEGGPLCVQFQQGAYFPAAIYLGGSTKSIVRAIDGDVVDMFNRAETSGNGGDNNTDGGVTHSSFTAIGATAVAALKVTIQPSAARDAGAGWRLNPDTTYRVSGAQKTGLSAGKYKLELKTVAGFEPPSSPNVTMVGGQLSEITYTYEEANIAPTVNNVANLAINQGGTAGPLAVTLFDADNAETSLVLTATSSNTTLVPNGNISFGGSGGNRTVTIVPAANRSGSSIITLTVSDGKLTDTDTFTLTVNPVNDAPTITAIPAQGITVNTSTVAIPFTVGDTETPAASLTVSGSSSNTTLVPEANIVFATITGASRTVTLTPVPGQLGTATITVTVSDGNRTTPRSFDLTVIGSPSESWRFVNFGSAANSGNAADSADPDGDGQSNRSEYVAGTNPNSAADVFRISSATRVGTQFSAIVPGKAGGTYLLQRRGDLTAGTWDSVASSGPLVADGPVILADPNATQGIGFYRVVIELTSP